MSFELVNLLMLLAVVVLWTVYIFKVYNVLARKPFSVLLGGRPMNNVGHALYDVVAKRNVYYFIDTLGHTWMAFHSWSLFRVEVDKDDMFWLDDNGIRTPTHKGQNPV